MYLSAKPFSSNNGNLNGFQNNAIIKNILKDTREIYSSEIIHISKKEVMNIINNELDLDKEKLLK